MGKEELQKTFHAKRHGMKEWTAGGSIKKNNVHVE